LDRFDFVAEVFVGASSSAAIAAVLSAFSRLRIAPRLERALLEGLAATDWPSRERALIAAYEIVATEFNTLGLCGPLPADVSPF